jgi:hypothetical protein
MVNAPPSLFSRLSIDSGMIMPVIFMMLSFWATSMLYAPFLDNVDDIAPSSLADQEGVLYNCCLCLEWSMARGE